MIGLLGRMFRMVRQVLLYIDHRLRRRKQIKKAKREDPNIYPFF